MLELGLCAISDGLRRLCFSFVAKIIVKINNFVSLSRQMILGRHSLINEFRLFSLFIGHFDKFFKIELQWDVEMKVPNVTMKSLGHFHFHCQMDLMKYCNQDLEVVLRPGQTDLWLACAQQGKGIGKKSSYIPLKETLYSPATSIKEIIFVFTHFTCVLVYSWNWTRW